MESPFPEMRSRLEGLVGGSESGLGYANFAAPARQPDGDIWRQMNIGVWDSGGKSKTEIDIWEVTLKISYSVEGLWMQSPSPKCFEVSNIRRSQLRHCEGSGQSQADGEETGTAGNGSKNCFKKKLPTESKVAGEDR